MSFPMGNIAVKKEQAAKPEGRLRVVRDSKIFGGEWQLPSVEAKPVLSLVKGNEEKQQISNPFTREKKEQPVQLPPDNWIG